MDFILYALQWQQKEKASKEIRHPRTHTNTYSTHYGVQQCDTHKPTRLRLQPHGLDGEELSFRTSVTMLLAHFNQPSKKSNVDVRPEILSLIAGNQHCASARRRHRAEVHVGPPRRPDGMRPDGSRLVHQGVSEMMYRNIP